MTISKIVAKWDVGVGWGNPKGERSCKVGAGGKTGDRQRCNIIYRWSDVSELAGTDLGLHNHYNDNKSLSLHNNSNVNVTNNFFPSIMVMIVKAHNDHYIVITMLLCLFFRIFHNFAVKYDLHKKYQT